MPKLTGLLESAIYVEDVDRAVRFYEGLFGFESIGADERLCALGIAGRQVLLICRRGLSGALAFGSHDATGPQHLAFAIPADTLSDWLATLAERGVPIEHRRVWPRGGESVYFRDPDGHLLELATPGVWPIY
jgi:catechol 2,3-dioxygenase-like lactoylglutathione lyase family enzyme